MKIIRRIIIVILAILLIGLIAYRSQGFEETIQAMKPENLTIRPAPEQTASIAHPDFIKEEYVAVLPEGTNVALTAKIDANNFQDVYTPRKAIDGIYVGPSYWEGKGNSYPNTLTLELEKSFPIHTIRICLSPMSIWGKRTQTFTVLTSSDGVDYQELISTKQYTFDPDTGNEVILDFDEIDAQFIQVEFTENSGAGGAQVAELEVYSD